MNRIDHEVLSKAEFSPLDNDNEFMSQLHFLRDLDIEVADQVKDAVMALEIIQLKLTAWLNENKTALETEEADFMMNIYLKHLDLLKKYEGVDFEKALVCYKMCLRVFQFIMAALYDYPDRMFGFTELPQQIKSL